MNGQGSNELEHKDGFGERFLEEKAQLETQSFPSIASCNDNQREMGKVVR